MLRRSSQTDPNIRMRCPRLADLPPPPPGRTGWPWTVETLRLPTQRPDGTPWPCISIVTPSYNQGEFIEETLRSVLLQGYPDLEYMVIDGDSTDGSVDIIRKYAHWLTHWVSEPDRGQAHAIDKGLESSTGDIFQWINSDDVLAAGALGTVATAFAGDHIDAVAGAVRNFWHDTDRAEVVANRQIDWQSLVLEHRRSLFHQPGVWLKTERLRRGIAHALDFRYLFDWLLIIQFMERYGSIAYLPDVLVHFRFHPQSKSVLELAKFAKERRAGYEFLIAESGSRRLRAAASLALRRFDFYSTVRDVDADRSMGGLRSAALIMRSLMLSRDVSLTRFAAGAIKRILLRGAPGRIPGQLSQ